jgi:predicted GNAT family acetyltransferase
VNGQDQPQVVHETDNSRFAVHVGGLTAALEYQLFEGKVVYTHTGVPGELEGKGIGGLLAKAGLEWARAAGLRVVPVCPFVSAYIQRHPEYAELTKR